MSERTKLLVSFSGGRSSAFMAYHLKRDYSDRYEMVFVFANTGAENEETLVFVDRCSREWGLNVVWVEAVTHYDEKKACTHRIVDFKTASRHGQPFEEMIKKYGIPNKAYPHCTRELKTNAIESYLDSIGWKDYQRAIGIRADEKRRVHEFLYPMVALFPTDKPMVNDWWAQQPFDLGLEDYRGNCKTCWKKSTKKLVRIAKETPRDFDFFRRMEAEQGLSGSNKDGRHRTFFRGHMTAAGILEIAKEALTFDFGNDDPDENSGCTESCEAFNEPAKETP